MPERKIILFTAYYPPHVGGVEKYTERLAAGLAQRGIGASVATSNTEGAAPKENINGVNIFRFDVWDTIGGRYPVLKPTSNNRRLFKELEAINADYLIANMRFYPLTLKAAKAAGRLNRPLIVIEHATGHFSVNNKALDYAGKQYEKMVTSYVKSKAERFYGVSKACSEWLKNFGIQSSGEIFNGVERSIEASGKEFSDKYAITEQSKAIIYAGRLIPEKGLKMLISAFKRIKQDYAGAKLIIAGSGPLENEISDEAENTAGLYFAGRLPHQETLNLMSACGIAVNPSSYPEGLPTLLLEAGILKKAVIATDAGGSSEIIPGSEFGELIPPGNEDELVKSLARLMADEKSAAAKSENLRKRVLEKFTWGKITDKLIRELYG